MNGFRQHTSHRAPTGFTLVELIIVIVIIGIVAAMVGVFISRPIEGYVDLSRRATLVDSAESSLRRIARDIRIALPNSVRITDSGTGTSFALEALPTLDGGKYDTDLDFTISDQDFNIVGCFKNIAVPRTSTADRLVINNLGGGTTCGNPCDAYAASGAQTVITPVGRTIIYSETPGTPCGTAPNVHHINIGGGGYQFRGGSTRQRLFIVQTPVTYLCDTSAGTLKRYADYAIQATQPATAAVLDALPGVTSAIVADHVNRCSATTTTSDVQQRGLVTLDLGLADQGETVRLIHQVQLDNSR